ncbi:hypothetical protein GCM10010431_66030 [Streptomyces kunmingensis]
MASAFQERKLRGMFAAFSADGDGYLRGDDFRALVARWRHLSAAAPGTELGVRVESMLTATGASPLRSTVVSWRRGTAGPSTGRVFSNCSTATAPGGHDLYIFRICAAPVLMASRMRK